MMIQLVIMILIKLPATLGTYQLWNYTWVIYNQAGDPVNSTSSISSSPLWWALETDLCILALGASPSWGLSDKHWPLSQAPGKDDNSGPPVPGCANRRQAIALQNDPNGIYVCPGSTHRPRDQNHRCGQFSDYFCAAWGCETSGDTYWKPFSTWDYITVSRSKFPHHCITKGWCNPLIIKFTDQGKKADWTGRGFEWGLRLYKAGDDMGFTFKIKLFKQHPSPRTPVAIGPNPELHHGQYPRRPSPTHSTPRESATASRENTTGLKQLTMPMGPPSSVSTFLSLLNTSLQVLRESNYSEASACWVCITAAPPFYEGIAHFEKPFFTNETGDIRWMPQGHSGLTLNQVIGLGLCLLGPGFQLPSPLLPICNQTLVVNQSSVYIRAANNSYFACSTGLTTYIITTAFIKHQDYCVQVSLFPRLIIHSPEDFLDYWERTTVTGIIRTKREPMSMVTMAVLLGLGVVGTGTGIASLVTTNQNYAQLSAAIDLDIQELQSGLGNLKESVASLAEVVLQNRRGLDLLFLQQGGLCAALKEECCFYSDKLGLVENSLKKVQESLEKRRRDREKGQGWFEKWFDASPWFATLLSAIAGPLIILVLLLIFGPCMINHLISFIRQRISAVQIMMIRQQYTHLNKEEEEEPETDV